MINKLNTLVFGLHLNFSRPGNFKINMLYEWTRRPSIIPPLNKCAIPKKISKKYCIAESK